MTIVTSSRLGPYEILTPLRACGIGKASKKPNNILARMADTRGESKSELRKFNKCVAILLMARSRT